MTQNVQKLAINYLQPNPFQPRDKVKKEDVAGAFLTNALLELEEGRLENIILLIREKIAYLDGEIEKTKPWELVKEDVKKFEEELEKLTNALFEIALIIEPFMPEISVKIQKGLENKEKINLFPRIYLGEFIVKPF